MSNDQTGLQLRSLVTKGGELGLAAACSDTEPGPDEVVVRVEAAPINPSDLGLLFGAADMSTAKAVRHAAAARSSRRRFRSKCMRGMAGRVDQSMPVGNEGAGVVVEGRLIAAAQALLGKTVAMLGGAMYSQYRTLKAAQCLLLPDGTTPAEGASCFVNPLTVARHGRDDASRRSHGARAHRGGVEPRPDAQSHLHQGRRRASSTSCASRSRRSCCASSARSTSATRARRRSWRI